MDIYGNNISFWNIILELYCIVQNNKVYYNQIGRISTRPAKKAPKNSLSKKAKKAHCPPREAKIAAKGIRQKGELKNEKIV